MSEHVFTFGGVPCLIVSQAHPATTGFGYVATPYVMKDEGRVLQPVGDRRGALIQLPASQEVDAVGRAVRYLEKRFGDQGPAPNWPAPRAGRFEESVVLIDERPE
jgi:hypothetical protein